MVLDTLSLIAIVYLVFKLLSKIILANKRKPEIVAEPPPLMAAAVPTIPKAITRRSAAQLQLDIIRESYVKATKSVAPDSTTLEILRAHGLYPTKLALEVRAASTITTELKGLLGILHKEGKVIGTKGRDATFGVLSLKNSEKLWIVTESPFTSVSSITAFVA